MLKFQIQKYATFDMINYVAYLFELLLMMFVNVSLYIPPLASSFVVQQYPFYTFKVFVVIEVIAIFISIFVRFKEFAVYVAVLNSIVLFLTGLAVPYLIVGVLRLGVLVVQFFALQKLYYLIALEYSEVQLREDDDEDDFDK